jgi:hypothetical protein
VAGPAAAQRLSGYAEGRVEAYFGKQNDRDPAAIGWGRVLLTGEAPLGPLRLSLTLRAEEATSKDVGRLEWDPADREVRRSPLSIREAWVRLPIASGLDVTLGRQTLGWGKTDGYSPADAFLPRDLGNPSADEKLPVWGVRAQGTTGALRADAFWAVTTTPWRLPILEGRNAPLPVPNAFLVDGEERPPRDGFGAVRLLATFGDWDVGLWGRAGVRPAPLLVFRLDRVTPVSDGFEIPVDRRFARERGLGGEVSRVVGGFVVRAELAALFSNDPGSATRFSGRSAPRGLSETALCSSRSRPTRDRCGCRRRSSSIGRSCPASSRPGPERKTGGAGAWCGPRRSSTETAWRARRPAGT